MPLRDLVRIRELQKDAWKLVLYELAFRLICRHRQGPRPNVLLFCSRRGGSTWLLNTLAAHPGTRYVGRPFYVAHWSRWKEEIPSLAAAAGHQGNYEFRYFVHFEGRAELQFREFARRIVMAERHLYPTLHFSAPYFHRVTDRVVFQITNATALIEWFDEHFPVATLVLLRHPISNALSITRCGWAANGLNFLNHRWFVDTQMTGPQVDLARRIYDEGSELARHVLDWTLKMLIPLRAVDSGRHPDWLTITYEHTVLQPDRVLELISQGLDFPDVEAMRAQIRRPSRNVSTETAEKVGDPNYLIKRWRKAVSEPEEQELMSIPAAFGIDAYRAGRFVAADRYLHGMPADGI